MKSEWNWSNQVIYDAQMRARVPTIIIRSLQWDTDVFWVGLRVCSWIAPGISSRHPSEIAVRRYLFAYIQDEQTIVQPHIIFFHNRTGPNWYHKSCKSCHGRRLTKHGPCALHRFASFWSMSCGCGCSRHATDAYRWAGIQGPVDTDMFTYIWWRPDTLRPHCVDFPNRDGSTLTTKNWVLLSRTSSHETGKEDRCLLALTWHPSQQARIDQIFGVVHIVFAGEDRCLLAITWHPSQRARIDQTFGVVHIVFAGGCRYLFICEDIYMITRWRESEITQCHHSATLLIHCWKGIQKVVISTMIQKHFLLRRTRYLVQSCVLCPVGGGRCSFICEDMIHLIARKRWQNTLDQTQQWQHVVKKRCVDSLPILRDKQLV